MLMAQIKLYSELPFIAYDTPAGELKIYAPNVTRPGTELTSIQKDTQEIMTMRMVGR